MKPFRFILSSSHSLILSLFLLAACGSPFADAPPVPDSTLASVLAELHLAQAHQQMRREGQLSTDEGSVGPAPPTDSSTVNVRPALRDSILAHYSLTHVELRAALDYYTRHPEQYTALYDRVIDRLNARRTARPSQRADEQPADE